MKIILKTTKIMFFMFIMLLLLFNNQNINIYAKDNLENEIIIENLERYYYSEKFKIYILINDDNSYYNIQNENIQICNCTKLSNRIEIELLCDSNEQNLKLIINVGPKIRILYMYNVNGMIFTSIHSFDDAFENYVSYMYENEKLTIEKLEIIRLNYYSKSIITDLINSENDSNNNESLSRSLSDVVIEGTLLWIDDLGVSHPCQYVMVEVYTKNNVLLNTIYTNVNGVYSYSYLLGTNSSDETLNDIYVIVKPSNLDVTLKNNYLFEYKCKLGEGAEYVSGNTKTINGYFYMNTSDGEPNDFGRAMQISQAAITAANYARVILNNDNLMEHVTIKYPTNESNSYYMGGIIDTIYLDNIDKNGDDGLRYVKPYAAWDIIMHEYGHHFSEILNLDDNPGYHHSSKTNLCDHIYKVNFGLEDCSDCVADIRNGKLNENECKDKGLKLAWGEGLATFFAIVAQQYYIDILPNIETVGDEFYTGNEMNSNSYEDLDFAIQNFSVNGNKNFISHTAIKKGDGNEFTITYILYNMYDSRKPHIGDGDNIKYDSDYCSLGHFSIWNNIRNSNAHILSDFINYFYQEDYSPDLIGEILEKTKVTAANLHVESSIYNLPCFEWDTQGSEYYPNDKFILEIADNNYNELITLDNITNNFYQLSVEEWNFVLNSFGVNFNWRISAYQMDDPVTGLYMTNWESVNKPDTENVLQLNLETNSQISEGNMYHWYKYTASEDGIYSFYTESNIDTVGYLFNNMVFELYTTGSIANNDNVDTTNNNFKIMYNLVSGQTVYLRVSTNNEICGSYKLHLEQTTHIHNYTYLYVGAGTLNHRSYCICTEYTNQQVEDKTFILENHVFRSYNTGYKCIKCLYYSDGPIITPSPILLNNDLEDIKDVVVYNKKEENYYGEIK